MDGKHDTHLAFMEEIPNAHNMHRRPRTEQQQQRGEKEEEVQYGCVVCGKDTTLACPVCKKVYYCSDECLGNDKFRHHDVCKKSE
jgi:hypothetical protein